MLRKYSYKNRFCVIEPLQNHYLEIFVKYIYEQDVVNVVNTHLIQKPYTCSHKLCTKITSNMYIIRMSKYIYKLLHDIFTIKASNTLSLSLSLSLSNNSA